MRACIRAESLTLDIPIFLQRERSGSGWKDLFMGAAFDPPKRRLTRLLENVSFELSDGDRLAILGRNGAGKSTLLRVLNRVYQPSSGSLYVSGSCQALLNMGLGFNKEATVRENIYLRGVAMGLKARFLAGQVGPILDFAGLREKANHRLHTLSSGQRIRLGFAISTSVQHDIMLMDEWVGTGDAEFVARATERMQSRVGGSKIVVLASHSVGLLNGICNKGLVMEGGRLAFFGDFRQALTTYNKLMEQLQEEHKHDPRQELLEMPVHGRVAKLVEWRDGTVVMDGWCVDSRGEFPGGLVIELGGSYHRCEKLLRISRPDVMSRFGLPRDDYGFRATFKLPDLPEVGDDERMRVLAGHDADYEGTPLQMAAEVVEQLARLASVRR